MYESNRYCFLPLMVLHSIHSGFRMVSFRSRLELNPVAKLERQRRKKNSVARAAKLDQRRLLQACRAAPRRRNLYRNANRARLREKLRQLLGATLFASECWTALSNHLPRSQVSESAGRMALRYTLPLRTDTDCREESEHAASQRIS